MIRTGQIRPNLPGGSCQIKTYLPGEFRQKRTYLPGGFWYSPYFANAQACTHVDLALVEVEIENAGKFEGPQCLCRAVGPELKRVPLRLVGM